MIRITVNHNGTIRTYDYHDTATACAAFRDICAAVPEFRDENSYNRRGLFDNIAAGIIGEYKTRYCDSEIHVAAVR